MSPTEPGAARATIYDVARAAGVSHQTVSRLLHGFTGIRPATRERVERALIELEYRPNLAARSLASNGSRRIGALVYELLEVGPRKTIQGASDAARRAGYLLDIVTLDPTDDAAVDEALTIMRGQDLAGILAFAPMDLLGDRIRQADFAVPLLIEAIVDPGASADDGPDAPTDAGMDAVVDHLVSLGHRDIFFVSGPREWSASRYREEAFVAALRRHGLHPRGSAEAEWSAASGYRAGLSLPLELGITAVVAANDQVALGLLRALAEQGIAVPHEISVMGFDNIPESEYFQPPLSTVSVDYEQKGRILMNSFLALIGDAHAAAETAERRNPPQLVVRSSTAPPPVGRP
ncbi:MAG TPA: LacI family DNA-binding transcriptional regulator [Galbitalea sp.]|jgi:LacI family transcriptional regulator